MSAIWIILAALVGAGGGLAIAIASARRVLREEERAAQAESAVLRKRMQLEAAAIKTAAETRAREQALEQRRDGDRQFDEALAQLASAQDDLEEREHKAATWRGELEDRSGELADRERSVQTRRDRAQGLQRDLDDKREKLKESLEALAGVDRQTVVERLGRRWLEEASSEAAQQVRLIEQTAADPIYARKAHQLMEIAVSRYRNHFLTERNISNIPLPEEVSGYLVENDRRLLHAIAEGSNVQLNLSEDGTAVRLEGLDGVGREVARRALRTLAKKPKALPAARADASAWVADLRERLDHEIQGLGRKAFSVLKVPKAHPEIVTLVGKLNFRTSYTQNQWLHAVEASFLAGMMASELGLDIGLARRATLMHDIGKALTHEIDGSHAVIGADIARRLGESEIVANAIGSHHADEPPSSIYAFLVAAADAMSGARPGARREHTDGYSTRLEDLERIGSSYRGVDRCYAVHGGRELRIYVRDNEITDLEAVDLSSEVAEQISEEMTFPGQVKVTVIRSTEAVSVAT